MLFSQQQTTQTKWVRGTAGPPEQPLWLQITSSEGKGLILFLSKFNVTTELQAQQVLNQTLPHLAL